MTASVPPQELILERKFLRGLIQQDPTRPVVLVGSWARRSQLPWLSDIDLLVIDEAVGIHSAPPRVQVISLSRAQFRKRALEGDDFSQWALRYGVPLGGRRSWESLQRELLPIVPWPKPGRSRDRATRALEAATTLLQMGDLPASTEETLMALSHLARSDLLAHGVFPLSRPELDDQLLAIGQHELAGALKRSIDAEDGLSSAELRSIHAMMAQRLSEPDRSPPKVRP